MSTQSKILVIDDDASMAMLLETMLGDAGYEVVCEENGKAGLERLASFPADLVLTDVRMPGLSGEDVLEAIRRSHPALPVMVMTAHGSVKSAVNMIRKGAFDYVTKPVDEDDLKVAIERALEMGTLRRENRELRSALAAGGVYGGRLIGQSEKMVEVFSLIERVAGTDSTVLITGETGTGKELVAQTIHLKSARASKPFVACNCAALNQNLLESELFGHEKGAFTGALSMRRGRFELAEGGTLFLDEIGETSLEFQAKLLRVLQEREIERVGGARTIPVDVRVITSTNRDLEEEVKEGNFRQDLFYRLRVVPIRVPSLRERTQDIVPMAEHFLRMYSEQYHQPVEGFSDEALADLEGRTWEGNVRELQHLVERAVVLAQQPLLEPADLTMETGGGGGAPPADRTLQAFLDAQTVDYVMQVLDSTGWQKQKAADLLGIDRATLYRMIKKYRMDEGSSG